MENTSLRSGQYIKVYLGDASYYSYRPNALPPYPPLLIDNELLFLLTKAYKDISEMNTTAELIPNTDLFIASYVRREALLSSQIEGTQATLEDVLSLEYTFNNDEEIEDVVNYVNALNYALDRMKILPISSRLLCETHAILLKNVRGSEKARGEFRKSQNWIGNSDSNINTAVYVPPNVNDINECMSELEKFINTSDMVALLKVALVHYQFETIHPFLDGNGRIGRMLITLMLLSYGCIKKPILYMSLFLKANQREYYDRLGEVRKNGNYEQWVKFFIKGISETAIDSTQTSKAIDHIFKKYENLLKPKTQVQRKFFDYIKEHPIFSIRKAQSDLNLSYNGVSSIVLKMKEMGIVKEGNDKKQRNRVFVVVEYLAILKNNP